MKITPLGAVREVTGSCYLIETLKSKFLVDCGMFQGSHFAHEKNSEQFNFDPTHISAVFLTHAHLDHCGRLPLLVRRGFKGAIYCTAPTARITELILRDAVMIMKDNARYYQDTPLYDEADVEEVLKRFKPMSDHGALCVKDIKAHFYNAGHILGSAFIKITDNQGANATFSGDLGNNNTPILKPKEHLRSTGVLFIESTYGDRLHEDESTRSAKLKELMTQTIKKGGVLLIPSFAVERTQEILFELNNLTENKQIPAVGIFLDSPMATEVNKTFDRFPKYYSKRAFKQITDGDNLFEFPGFRITASRDESKSINTSRRPKVIIAGAGMMNGGRILHHLVRYLGDKNTTLLIIGYQANGTLGRELFSGSKKVDVMNERIQVKAQVVSIGGYSAHADQKMLLDWIKSAKRQPKKIYCVHGEEQASSALAKAIKTETGIEAVVPKPGETIEA